MKLAYVILFMIAANAVLGRTISKRDANSNKDNNDDNKNQGDDKEGDDKEGDDKEGDDKEGDDKENKNKSPVAPRGCTCFTDAGPGGDDNGPDDDHSANGRDDGRGGRTDGHSSRCSIGNYRRAPAGAGRFGSYCRNDFGGSSVNVRSCNTKPTATAANSCVSDCCSYCCFNNTPRIGGD